MRSRRGARTALLTALVGFFAIQAGLDVLLGGLWQAYYSHKLRALRRALHSADHPQLVVMLGSSRTDHALNGSAVEPLLARELGRPVVVYNFGVPTAGPVTHLLHLRRLLADGVRPDLLLVEVMPSFLLSRRGGVGGAIQLE